jgi:hydrogenase maturation protein HypF
LPCTAALNLPERQVLKSQLERRFNAPLTSSLGRMFDAVASLIGVRHIVNYEAQAAIELEALIDPTEDESYPFNLQIPQSPEINNKPLLIGSNYLFSSIVNDYHNNISVPKIAARFHNGVARMVLNVCRELRTQTGIAEVVLSGGVWQNMTLLGKTINLLQHDQFKIYAHEIVPPNDGGLALGQSAVAAQILQI